MYNYSFYLLRYTLGHIVRSALLCTLFSVQYLGTVHVEPPVADEILLVEQSSVGAQEVILEVKMVINWDAASYSSSVYKKWLDKAK
jgi:hypothetical protein